MENSNSRQYIQLKSQENGTQPHAQPMLAPNFLNFFKENQNEDDLNLRQIWSVIKHRKVLIAAVALGFTSLVGLWTAFKTPLYEGEFQLLVADPSPQNSNANDFFLQQMGVMDVDYDSQIEVLRSSSIVEPIVKTINQKYPDLTYEDLIPGKGKSPLDVSQVKKTKILDITYRDTDPQKVEFILNTVAKAYLDYSLKERQTQAEQGLQFLQTQLPKVRQQVNEHQKQLESFRQQYRLIDPEDYAKELTQQLFNLEEKYSETQVKLNETVSLYKLLQKQIGLDPNQTIASSYLSESTRYQNLLNQLQDIEIELAKQSAILSAQHPLIQTLKEKRSNLLPLLNQEAQKVLGPKFTGNLNQPDASNSPESLRSKLYLQFVQAANDFQVLQVTRSVVAREIETVKAQIKQMPSLARRYTDLQRELAVTTQNLNRLLEAQAKLQLEAAQQAQPWKLISPPTVGEDPVSPRPVRNMTLGIVAGVLLGLGAAFLAERLDPVFHSSEELKEAIKLPLLGSIPLQKDLGSIEKVLEISLPKLQIGNINLLTKALGGSDRSRYGYKTSGFLEAFRSLNTNIRLLGSDQPLSSLVVTSAAPAEGKSTISTNLAKAAAAMGQRVLIIDADLRRPQVHARFEIPNEAGLSNILATGVDVDSVIQTVPQWENVHVLTAGDIPPDPIRLLSSKRMQLLMEQLQQDARFDLIIYDTPPVLGFSEARILGAATTGIVLVARLGKTDRSLFRNAIEDLKVYQVPILGIVANGVSRTSHYGYGSSYYYNRYYSQRKDQ
jgi:capsular exopolysaccharide synthesis family protein